MKEIIPYKTAKSALESLYNGGRFYNLITKADDGNINSAELSKVAGVISGKQQMILFLEMSLSQLDAESRKDILRTLSTDLKSAIHKYPTQNLLPSEAEEKGILSQNAIITGIPTYIESKSDFSGFIMIPIMTGKVTTFMMVPIIDHFDVYEVRDQSTSETFLIAHSKSSEKLPAQKITFGGILKELKKKDNEEASATIYLETHYFINA